jgi:hypothetical protein
VKDKSKIHNRSRSVDKKGGPGEAIWSTLTESSQQRCFAYNEPDKRDFTGYSTPVVIGSLPLVILSP